MRPAGRATYGRAMVTMGQLQAYVASSFERLNLPSWQDPHPAMVSPRKEEYSRVTNPERYRAPAGGRAGGGGSGPGFDALMDLCRRLADGETVRLPKNTEAVVGRSWLS